MRIVQPEIPEILRRKQSRTGLSKKRVSNIWVYYSKVVPLFSGILTSEMAKRLPTSNDMLSYDGLSQGSRTEKVQIISDEMMIYNVTSLHRGATF